MTKKTYTIPIKNGMKFTAKKVSYPIRKGMRFTTSQEARSWGLMNGKGNCLPYQRWQVVRIDDEYAIGVYSRNTDVFSHFAE